MMKKVLVPALCAFASLVPSEVVAQSESKPPQKIDLGQLPQQSKMIDDVVVPVPSEIFGVLDKLGKPVWPKVQRKDMANVKPLGGQAQTALLLGTVIAEGFVAVMTEDVVFEQVPHPHPCMDAPR